MCFNVIDALAALLYAVACENDNASQNNCTQ